MGPFFFQKVTMNYYNGKNVLITGAASGIGKLMAQKLESFGANLILVDVNEEALVKMKTEFKKEYLFFKANLAVLEEIKALSLYVSKQIGVLDVLINNAGVVFGGEFEKQTLEKHILTYDVNTKAPVAMIHELFSLIEKSKEANIVNISSASGLIGLPYGTTYASSKWALLGFSESLRLELKERSIKNISVTTVCPSYISTGMFAGVKAPMLLPWLKPEEIVHAILSGVSKKKAFVKEPFVVKWVDFLKGILPLSVFVTVNKIIGVSTSMVHWKGRN